MSSYYTGFFCYWFLVPVQHQDGDIHRGRWVGDCDLGNQFSPGASRVGGDGMFARNAGYSMTGGWLRGTALPGGAGTFFLGIRVAGANVG